MLSFARRAAAARSAGLIAFLSSCAAMGGHAVALKALRVRELPPLDIGELVLLLAADGAAYLALAAAGVALISSSAGRRSQLAILAALQTVLACFGLTGVVAHRYFVTTGSILDGALAAFSLARLDERAPVVIATAPWWVWLHLAAIGVLALVPVGLLLRRPPQQKPRSLRLSAGGALAATLLFVAAWSPQAGSAGLEFTREPLLHLLASAGEAPEISFDDDAGFDDLENLRLAPTDRRERRPRNVVIVLLESTRAFSVTPYVPELKTTPFLAELARRSLLVERAYAVTPHTSKALVATLCGFPGAPLLKITESMPGGMPGRCLPRLLAEQGFRTAYFQSATQSFENRHGLVGNMGFETFVPGEKMPSEGFVRANYFGLEDAVMLEPSRRWLEEQGDAPFLAVYLANTPHHNYQAPRRYGRLPLAEDGELNGYLNSVRYVDFFLRDLFAQYRALGFERDTLFVVVGDHGEGFGEHGRFQHDDVIYEEGLRVPLLVVDPTDPRERRVEGPASQLDILPTVVERLGFSVAQGSPWGAPLDALPEGRPVYSTCYRERRCLARMQGREKLVHHFGIRPDQFFDLEEDPKEKRDLSRQEPEKTLEWRTDALHWNARIQALHRPYRTRTVRAWVRSTPPAPRMPLDVRFGRHVELVGVDLPQAPVRPGHVAEVTYHFRLVERLPTGYQLFVHGEGEGRFLNLDHTPVGGLHPFEEWRVGEYVSDVHRIKVPSNWKAPTMKLFIGIYHPRRGRLGVHGAPAPDNRYPVGTITVDRPAAAGIR